MKPKVTICGHVCIDHNKIGKTFSISWGSAVMYIANYFKNTYGLSSNIIAPYGEDFEKYAANVNILNNSESSQTLIYKNILENEKRIQYCFNTEATSLPRLNAKMKKALQETDILFIAPLLPNYSYSYVAALLEHVPSGCLKILSPQGYMRRIDASGLVSKGSFNEAEKIIELFDIVVMSDEDYKDALEAAKIWTSATNTKIIITQNRRGATLFEKNIVRHIPTRPLAENEIKNSIGSGDTFSAELAHGIYAGKAIDQAIVSAHKAVGKKLRGV